MVDSNPPLFIGFFFEFRFDSREVIRTNRCSITAYIASFRITKTRNF